MTFTKPTVSAYREIKVNGERKALHRFIAERAIGKRLPPNAEVHHVDGDKGSLNPRLVICQDAAYHSLLHMRQRTLRAGGDPNTQRVCCTCQQVKLKTDFRKNSFRRSGVASECGVCSNVRRRDWRHRKSAERKASREIAS